MSFKETKRKVKKLYGKFEKNQKAQIIGIITGLVLILLGISLT